LLYSFELHMYCPRCATETSEVDAKFCRSCGVDLNLVTQAMAGKITWRSQLLNRLDHFLLSQSAFEERENAREGRWNTVLGIGLLGFSIVGLITESRLWSAWVFLLIFGFVSLKIGIGNLRLYKRYQRGGDPPQVRPNEGALTLLKIPTEKRKLSPSQTATSLSVSPSVTERTTELLTEEKKD
jgi:ribosomal protein L37E